MLLVTGLTLLGEGLNDIINPLLRVKGLTRPVGARSGEAAPEPVADRRRPTSARRTEPMTAAPVDVPWTSP